MPYRFTYTQKWADPWFSELGALEKLLFLYLCDNCDIAGFIEINYRRWAFDLNTTKKGIEGATKGLQRGLVVSPNERVVFLKNFLKHQKNLPLNENNAAHRGILKCIENHLVEFGFPDINEFLEGATKGLSSSLGNGNGNGNNIGTGTNTENGSTLIEGWRTNFDIYLAELRQARNEALQDPEWIKKQQLYNPRVNIPLSIDKACVNFWATEAGWKHKKGKKTVKIDWRSTFANAIALKSNKVYDELPQSQPQRQYQEL